MEERIKKKAAHQRAVGPFLGPVTCAATGKAREVCGQLPLQGSRTPACRHLPPVQLYPLQCDLILTENMVTVTGLTAGCAMADGACACAHSPVFASAEASATV